MSVSAAEDMGARTLPAITLRFVLACISLTACASVRPITPNSSNPVRSVAVLPFINNTDDVDGPELTRKIFADELGRHYYIVKPMRDTDLILRDRMGITLGSQLDLAEPKMLCRELGVDGLFYASLDDFGHTDTGVSIEKRVRLRAKLMNCKTGETVWKNGIGVKQAVYTPQMGFAGFARTGTQEKELPPFQGEKIKAPWHKLPEQSATPTLGTDRSAALAIPSMSATKGLLLTESHTAVKIVLNGYYREDKLFAEPVEYGLAVPPGPGELSMLWNVWAEPSRPSTFQPQYDPSSYLIPDTSHLFVLDISSIMYDPDSVRAFGHAVSGALKREIDDLLKNKDLHVLTLKVIALPDPVYFEKPNPADAIGTLTISLDTIRGWKPAVQPKDTDDVFKIMADMAREKKGPDFLFGRVAFKIRTRRHEGPAVYGSVGFSFWTENRRPVDEIAVKFCIATSKEQASITCRGVKKSQYGFKGFDSLRLASEESPFPDGAIHLVNVDPTTNIVGVFLRNDRPEGEYVTWDLTRTSDELRTFLRTTQLNVFANATTTSDLHLHGSGLYDTLFPSNTPDGEKARQTFEQFVKDSSNKPATGGAQSPSIFVRLVNQGDLIPLGLMAVPLEDIKFNETADEKEARELREFLGFIFRIETPLGRQQYERPTACITRWTLAFPPDGTGDDALTKARSQATTVVKDKWEKETQYFEKMTEFGARALSAGEETSAVALAVLSHHTNNQLAFAGNDKITSANVQRKYGQPSLAILNGCGTVQPGAEEFIKELNVRGVYTAIATSTEVEAPMAGDFFNCLDEKLEQHKEDSTYTISQAYFDTLQCLKEKAPTQMDDKYGARVLKYALLGNGNLKLCLPKKP